MDLVPFEIHFYVWDRWETNPLWRRLAFLGSERPSVFAPLNWADDYPFIYVDGQYFFYP